MHTTDSSVNERQEGSSVWRSEGFIEATRQSGPGQKTKNEGGSKLKNGVRGGGAEHQGPMI